MVSGTKRNVGIDAMTKTNKLLYFAASAVLSCNLTLMMIQSSAAFQLASNLANRMLVCGGGAENNGVDYRFLTQDGQVARFDNRFPGNRVLFQLGGAQKGQLQRHWSYETLSQKNGSHVMLYERLSLRSSVQTQHIYRTYEIFSQNRQIFVTIYDGVNGARDWKMKATRECHPPGGSRRTYVTRKMPSNYWDPNN